MTEPGNTFESQHDASSGSEEMDNTVLTDASSTTGGELSTGESTAVPESGAAASESSPSSEAAALQTSMEKDDAAAAREGAESAPAQVPAGESSAPQTEPTSEAPATAMPAGDAPASEETAPAPEAPAAEAASAQESGTPDAGEESAAGDDDQPEAGGERRRGGRQLPKVPEEQMREIWNELIAKKNAGEEIDLEVISTNRGGVVAQYKGVEVFVPISHWSLDRHNTEGVSSVGAGDTFQAHVLEITNFDTDARRVTATRRTLLRRDLLGSLEVGQRLRGRVASILDFGAFVDLGGVDGLVHASEISYDRTRRPSELLNKGDEVEVVIREIDREKKRIYLGMKELQPSPWEGVEERYPQGTLQQGRVVGIGKNGAFIELEPGLEGFVRVSELSWTKRVNNPKEILKKGMDIEIKVLDSSERKQRLSLSYRQAQDDPWPGLAQKFSVGTNWEGEIREISNKGVVVSVDEVEGFLPRGRMGREAKRLPDMKVGEKLNVHVIEIDPSAHSLIYGLAGQEGDGGERERRGGGRERGDRDRGDRGDRGRMGSVSPVNEMKSADTVTSFALGDIINDAMRKALNFGDEANEAKKPAQPKAESPAPSQAQPEAGAGEQGPSEQGASPAQEGQQSAEAPASEQNAGAGQEHAAAEGAPDAGMAAGEAASEGGQTFPTSFEEGAGERGSSDEERPV